MSGNNQRPAALGDIGIPANRIVKTGELCVWLVIEPRMLHRRMKLFGVPHIEITKGCRQYYTGHIVAAIEKAAADDE